MAMDLFPTILDLLDLQLPEEKPLDGVSLSKVLREGRASLPERELFFGYEPKLGTAMREGNWKMIVKEDRVRLYDLSDLMIAPVTDIPPWIVSSDDLPIDSIF